MSIYSFEFWASNLQNRIYFVYKKLIVTKCKQKEP